MKGNEQEMPTFTDDFNRADGPLGLNWSVLSGNPQISGNKCFLTYPGNAYVASVSDSGRHSISYVGSGSGGYQYWTHPVVKLDPSNGTGYFMTMEVGPATTTCNLYYMSNWNGGLLAQTVLSYVPQATYTVTLTWADGELSGTLDGATVGPVGDSRYATNTRAGFFGGTNLSYIDDFSFEYGTLSAFTVSVQGVTNEGQSLLLNFGGTNTAWTPGTPGQPIFACDVGVLDQQSIYAATYGQARYTPASIPCTVTFTDPSTNLTVQLEITSATFTGGTGQSTPLSQNVIDYLEYSATHGGWGILNEGQTVTQSSGVTTVGDALGWFWRTLAKLVDPDGETPSGNTYIDVLWYILNGRNAPVVNESIYDELLTTRNTANHIEELFAGVEPDTWVSILQLMSYLKGVDNKDLSQVFDQIGASDTAMSASLMNAIEAVRGTDLPSIRTVVDLIGELSTIAGYDLSSVKGWVEAARGTDLPTIRAVLDFLQTIRGNNVVTLDGLALQLGGLSDASETIYLMLHTLTNAETLTLQSILDAIAAIPASDLSAVLTAISDLRGDSTSTVKAILDSLTAYRNPQGYTVQSILDKIGSPPDGNEWNPLLLGLLLLLVAAGDGVAVASFISKVKDGTLDTILDIIDIAVDVANLFHNLWDHFNPASPTYRPTSAPVYPGPDKVYWDTAIPFDGQITIEQQMDGARIDIETPGEHPFAIKLSTPTRYGRLGVFSFMADDGLLEPIQPVQWAKQIITAKGIAIPMGLVVQCKAGTIGTITPWRLK